MGFDRDVYYGKLLKGDLQGAINYVKQYPDQAELYLRFVSIFEQERYHSYDVDNDLNAILLAYQQYYREVFYLRIERDQAAQKLRDRLVAVLGMAGCPTNLDELEQDHLPALFMSRGLHFLGGKTSGWYGPYIWQTTETVSYDVELPDCIQPYTVRLLDGFISRSWIDYLSFGEIGPGGWSDGDGTIHCIKTAWDLDSEHFQVSLLKHEAQHARDLKRIPDISSTDLEFRAKLVELIYSTERNLLISFAKEADDSDSSNGHAMAAYRIVRGFEDALNVKENAFSAVPMEQVRSTARILYEQEMRAYIWD